MDPGEGVEQCVSWKSGTELKNIIEGCVTARGFVISLRQAQRSKKSVFFNRAGIFQKSVGAFQKYHEGKKLSL
jgi:hypothetical protein